MADMMQRRNSPMIKTVMVVAGLGSIVYLIYLNHDANTKLKNTDDRAERYRRSHESLSAQLQDLSAAKESSERKAMADREEMINRLSARAKESTLLKSQYDDLRSDFDKLEADKNKLELDMESLVVENKREYEQMKTLKDLEIAKLKDTIANQHNQIEKLHGDIQDMATQNKNLQVYKDTARSNITKLHQDLIRVKFAQNAQLGQHGQVQGNLPIQGGLQPAQGGLQPAQGGALVMNQNQNVPPGGAVVNQNNAIGGGVNGQGDGQNQGIVAQDVAQDSNKPNEGDDRPVIPGVNDLGNFQIKPADGDGERPVGYNHEGDEHKDEKIVAEHKAEDDAQHQVQPPNLLDIDNGGINHRNPHDRMFPNRRGEGFKHIGFEEKDKNDQEGHDNRIENQGAVNLQVQEPVLGGNPDREEHNGLEEEGDDREENIEDQKEGFHADQFLRNGHLNKQFAPRDADQNADQNGDENGPLEKENYYEEDDEDEDNDNNDDYDVQRNVRRGHQEV